MNLDELLSFVNSEHSYVRVVAARDSELTESMIQKLLVDSSVDVRIALAGNPIITPSHIDTLLDDVSLLVRNIATANKNASSGNLTKALAMNHPLDDVKYVWTSAASNPNCTPAHLNFAMQSDCYEVRASAVSNKVADKRIIDIGLCDTDVIVRAMAKVSDTYKKSYPNGHEVVKTVVAL